MFGPRQPSSLISFQMRNISTRQRGNCLRTVSVDGHSRNPQSHVERLSNLFAETVFRSKETSAQQQRSSGCDRRSRRSGACMKDQN